MNFFEHQDKARKNSKKLILLFILAVVSIVLALYFATQYTWFVYFMKNERMIIKDHPLIWSYSLFWKIAAGTLAVIIAGSVYKIFELSEGGQAVAHMMGARLVDSDPKDHKERQLMNVVEEMSLAAGIPVPNVYLLDREYTINAFAAGYTTGDAVIGVNRGTIDKLKREELQGVIAHEFSHILNGDMKLNIQLMGLLHGILLISLIGREIMGIRTSRDKEGGGLIFVGIFLFAIGGIGYLFGKLIQSSVSRQREYLADASAVQFTRNPDGIGNALKKIAGYLGAPATGSHLFTSKRDQISHMTFGAVNYGDLSGFMSSHPSIDSRIQAIDPHFNPAEHERVEPLPHIMSSTTDAVNEPLRTVAAAGLHMPVATKLKYNANVVQNMVGTIPPAAVFNESAWLLSLDPLIQKACHHPQKAKAIIYILMAESNAGIKNEYTKKLQLRDPYVVSLFNDLWELVQATGLESRLKLVDLSLPALRRLPVNECQALTETMAELIQLDKNVTMFEYLMIKIVRRHLKHHHNPKSTADVSITNIKHVQNEIQTLLDAIACCATDQSSSASTVDLKKMDAALKTLRRTSYEIRCQVIETCAKAILEDQNVSWREAELIRAIGTMLDCPVPPLNA